MRSFKVLNVVKLTELVVAGKVTRRLFEVVADDDDDGSQADDNRLRAPQRMLPTLRQLYEVDHLRISMPEVRPPSA